MNIQELADDIQNKNTIILGKRYSGKTILSIYFILKNLEYFNNIYIFFSDFFSYYSYLSYLNKKNKNIKIYYINNFEILKNILAQVLKNIKTNDLLFFDRFSLIPKLILEERIKIYSNIIKIFFISFLVIKNYNGSMLINYTFEENDKVVNLVKYWCDLLINIDRIKNNIKLNAIYLSEGKEVLLETNLDYLLNMLKYGE